TFDPGARLVLTQGFVCRPRSMAFLATRPAASITEGFEVFVQLVIAAMTTEPCFNSAARGSALVPVEGEADALTSGGRPLVTALGLALLSKLGKASANDFLTSPRRTRS